MVILVLILVLGLKIWALNSLLGILAGWCHWELTAASVGWFNFWFFILGGIGVGD